VIVTNIDFKVTSKRQFLYCGLNNQKKTL